MVICVRCALTGRVVPLHIETWFVRTHRHHHITRYWECPTCKLTGHTEIL